MIIRKKPRWQAAFTHKRRISTPSSRSCCTLHLLAHLSTSMHHSFVVLSTMSPCLHTSHHCSCHFLHPAMPTCPLLVDIPLHRPPPSCLLVWRWRVSLRFRVFAHPFTFRCVCPLAVAVVPHLFLSTFVCHPPQVPLFMRDLPTATFGRQTSLP